MNKEDPYNIYNSIIVQASAGSGKTTLLVSRVLKLLLFEKKWKSILCITFTKIAAQEMLLRINHTIYSWHQMNNQELIKALKKILQIQPKQETIFKASNLFKNYYKDINNNIRIYTIHAFAQYILQNFSYEISLQPYFHIIDENHISYIVTDIFNAIQSNINNNKDTYNEIKIDIIYLLKNWSINQIKNLIKFIIFNANKFCWNDNDIQKIIIKIKYSQDEITQIIKDINNIIDSVYSINNHLDQILSKFKPGEKIDNNIKLYFFTKNNQMRKQLKFVKDNPDLKDKMLKLQSCINIYQKNTRAAILLEYFTIIKNITKLIISEYTKYKKKNNYLTYDDLIYHTCKNLNNPKIKDFILYKLDQETNHILIDEAQDTSIIQWKIIDSLIDNFYYHSQKSIFIVGDIKQSIYSFQGANLSYFQTYLDHIKNKFHIYNKKYQIINLTANYRSNSTIVTFVKEVFKYLNINIFSSTLSNTFSHKGNLNGSVEIWEYIHHNTQDQVQEFSDMLILYIKDIVEKQIFLPSVNRTAQYKDFAILLQRRSNLMSALYISIKKYNISNSNHEYSLLKYNTYIKSIIAVAKFILSPFDNYRFASILKSHFFHIDDHQLHCLIHNARQTNQNLWSYIKQQKDSSSIIITNKIKNIITQYNTLNMMDFFISLIELIKSNNKNDHHIALKLLLDNLLYFSKHFLMSLESFVHWIENTDIIIKIDHSNNEGIFISTIHGSKGLEFPITILADTNAMPVLKYPTLLNDGEHFIYDNDTEYVKELKRIHNDNSYLEYMRLLYVGMTRAKDQLIICGKSKKNINKKSWYALLDQYFNQLNIQNQQLESEKYHLNKRIYTLYDVLQKSSKKQNIEKNIDNTHLSIFNLPKIESKTNTSIYSSPVNNNTGFSYGIIAHKILEDSIKTKKALKKHPMLDYLDDPYADSLCNKITLILNNPFLKRLIHNADDILTEATYTVDNIIYVIDCLIINKNNIYIIEYKSDQKVNNIPEEYRMQILQYITVIYQLYPHHNIKAYLLWIETNKFIQIKN